MKIGVHVIRFNVPGGAPALAVAMAEVGRAAEDAGLDNLSVMDHFFQMEMIGGPDEPMLEGYTTLGFLAACTSTVELQALVTGVTYRHPGLLAKIVTTLDVLSNGRAMLGIGAAWYEREHRGLGVRFPVTSERFERLEETLQIVLQMWSDNDGPYNGKHYQLAETLNNPQPIARPHPPIMVGGTGERKTLRLVAKYADACNLFASPNFGLDAVGAKLAVLEEHCAREGTDYSRIRKTILWNGGVDPVGGAQEFADLMNRFAEIGIDEVHLTPPTGDAVGFIDALGGSAVSLVHSID